MRAESEGAQRAYLQQGAWRHEGGSTLAGAGSLSEDCIYTSGEKVHLIPSRRVDSR